MSLVVPNVQALCFHDRRSSIFDAADSFCLGDLRNDPCLWHCRQRARDVISGPNCHFVSLSQDDVGDPVGYNVVSPQTKENTRVGRFVKLLEYFQ